MKNKLFMSFSKRIVTAVTIMVTIVCASSIFLSFMMNHPDSMTEIVRAYINYAIIVFASYTGNSVTQKVLSSKFSTKEDGTTDSSETNG